MSKHVRAAEKSSSLKPTLAASMVVPVSKLAADVNTFTAPALMGTVLLHKYITEKMNSESVKILQRPQDKNKNCTQTKGEQITHLL